jgi:hypothetical protein
MTTPRSEWLHRHRSHVMTWLTGLLLLVVAAETFVLIQQRSALRATETQSAKLLTTFLRGDTTQVSGASGTLIRMQNVRFKWSDRVYIDTGNMAVRAVPLQGGTVDFDEPESFRLSLQQSVVRIRPDVLEGMFNESVFNYPHSKLRNLKVTLAPADTEHRVHVKGSVNVGVWIPFTMSADLSVDTKTNTLVMDISGLKVLGMFPASALIKLKPFHLENIISLPPNKSVLVEGNQLMVKPLGLFPPPRIEGTMSDIAVEGDGIRLRFAGSSIPAPEASAPNYVFLKGGTSEFGRFRMVDTDILILDESPTDPFVFSLAHYADMIPRSKVELHDTKSVRITMPDFPNGGDAGSRPH